MAVSIYYHNHSHIHLGVAEHCWHRFRLGCSLAAADQLSPLALNGEGNPVVRRLTLNQIASHQLLSLDNGEFVRKSVHETKVFSGAPRSGPHRACVLLFRGLFTQSLWFERTGAAWSPSTTPNITRLRIAWYQGDQDALAKLKPLAYRELHRLAHGYMARGRRGQDVDEGQTGGRADGTRQLTQEDPEPRTIYRVAVKAGAPLVVKVGFCYLRTKPVSRKMKCWTDPFAPLPALGTPGFFFAP